MKRINKNKGKPIEYETLDNGCIICTSHKTNKDGYHRMYHGKDMQPRCIMLHRWMWQEQKGPIPDGFEVDHKCRNRRCCNTDHLQLLSITDHKVKTNKERYADRIEGVILAITEGSPNKLIEKAFNVTGMYVNRYRRNLNKGI